MREGSAIDQSITWLSQTQLSQSSRPPTATTYCVTASPLVINRPAMVDSAHTFHRRALLLRYVPRPTVRQLVFDADWTSRGPPKPAAVA